MSDLDKDSRCVGCKDITYQCSKCQKKDKDDAKASKAAAVASKAAAAAASVAAPTSAPAPAPSDASAPALAAPAPAPSASDALSPASSVPKNVAAASVSAATSAPASAPVLAAPAPAPSASAALAGFAARLAALDTSVPKKRAAKPKGASAKKPTDSDADPSAESAVDEDENSDSDDNEHGALGITAGQPRKPPMPRILQSERVVVECWLQKNRKDGKMVNARWIRNGGAKGQGMTATSGEVKTAGAHEALAIYVNKTLGYGIADKRVWSKDIAKRRFQSMYKSFKEALLLGAKGNSLAGCSLAEIENNNTSLLNKQKAKCASFEVLLTLYENHPSVKPVFPMEQGAPPREEVLEALDSGNGEAGSDVTVTTTALAAAAPVPPAVPSGGDAAAVPAPAATKGGKTPAPFAMKLSKEPKKMDLGEAYLLAQTAKTALLATQGTAKQRSDMIVALSLQGKSKEEIEGLLSLLL